MLQITTNKNLTHIASKQYHGVMRTSSFDELTGIADHKLFDQIPKWETESTAVRAMEEYTIDDVGRIETPTSIMINGLVHDMRKLAEATDLPPGLFDNLLAASLIRSERIDSYRGFYNEFTSSAYHVLRHSIDHGQPSGDKMFKLYKETEFMFSNEIFAKTMAKRRALRSNEKCIYREYAISLQDALSNTVFEFITSRMNEIRKLIFFYYNGKKYYYPTISEESVFNVISKIKSCYEEKRLSDQRIDSSHLLGILADLLVIEEKNSRFLQLENEKGERCILRTQDLIPGPFMDLMKKHGKYGKI